MENNFLPYHTICKMLIALGEIPAVHIYASYNTVLCHKTLLKWLQLWLDMQIPNMIALQLSERIVTYLSFQHAGNEIMGSSCKRIDSY